jgi:CRP/FNR family transcriptional regulator, cyclic AMP receptor protein
METVRNTRYSHEFPGGNGAGFLNGRVNSTSSSLLRLGSACQDEIQPQAARPLRRSFVAEAPALEVRDALAESDVFGSLTDDDLDRVIEKGRVVTYGGGALVFRKGDRANDFMIVLSGRIRLSSTSRQGREVLFDLIGPGRCFGELALVDGTNRRLDATAVKPSAVFTLRRSDVLACLEAHPEVAVRIIRVLCVRLSRAMEMFEHRTQLDLPTRSARMLLRLAREYGDGVRIELRISQAEIAGLVGATREKVNRQLRAWCREGILAVDEGHLIILDRKALRAIAEED